MSKTFSTMSSTVMKTAMIVPRICGITTWKKIFTSVAPSIRAASSVSSGTPLIAAESSTIANPACSQIRMTISSTSLKLNAEVCSHETGLKPIVVQIALSRPICGRPSGAKA